MPDLNIFGARHVDQRILLVNKLRRLGKPAVIAAFHRYLDEDPYDPDHNSNAFVLFRYLFIPHRGWSPPLLGGADPEMVHQPGAFTPTFPLFPIIIVDGYPFMLARGYGIGGTLPPAQEVLPALENMDFISTELPPYDETRVIVPPRN